MGHKYRLTLYTVQLGNTMICMLSHCSFPLAWPLPKLSYPRDKGYSLLRNLSQQISHGNMQDMYQCRKTNKNHHHKVYIHLAMSSQQQLSSIHTGNHSN